MSHSTSHPDGSGSGSAPATGRIRLLVNGEPRDIGAGARLAELIAEIGLGERKLAVAINREVVPRARHAERVLDEGDRVEILEAVGGG